MWRCSKSRRTNECEHTVHVNGLTPVCDLSCRALCSDREKALAQNEQIYFFWEAAIKVCESPMQLDT